MQYKTYYYIAIKCTAELLKCTVYHDSDLSKHSPPRGKGQEAEARVISCIIYCSLHVPVVLHGYLDLVGTLDYQRSMSLNCSFRLKSSPMINSFISCRSLLKTCFLREAFLDNFV